MTRAVILFIGFCLVLAACTQRMICPAYQSAFIYDKDELRKKFSYFQDDSTPKVYTASKNKYLVAEPVSYRHKIRTMQTVQMKPVPVHVPDSLINADSVITADLDRAARSIIDSTMIVDVPKDTVAAPLDSIYVITKDKELRLLKYNGPDSLDYDSLTQRYVAQKPKYYVDEVRLNIEQDNYMWYLRDALVLPDVRLAKSQQGDGGEKQGVKGKSAKKKKGGLKGFFKNLFRKKSKQEIDSTLLPPAPKEDFDYVDPDTVTKTEAVIPVQPQQNGLFGRKKTSLKASKKKEKKPEKSDAKLEGKKKNEGDGF